jgi:hypothetical protein
MSIIKHTANFNIDQPIDVLFPLFSAEGEKLWVPGWTYENIMGSTELHEDYVFLTTNHDHAMIKAIWLVKAYKPESYFVQFYKVEPENKVGIISVQCTEISDDATGIEVSYEYIGLSKEGNKFIEDFTSLKYDAFIDEWKKLLLNYFGA